MWPTKRPGELCVALSGWSPWGVPSDSLLRAMTMVQRARGHVTTVDTTTTCMRRAEAVTELLYETAHYANLPTSCRCRRLARRRLQGCPQWGRIAKGTGATWTNRLTAAGISTEAALERLLSEGSCAWHQKDHGPGNPQCGGMVGLTATMVYNWRLLWWSSSWTQRREHVLLLYVQSLRAHRAARLPDDRWRVQYTFLGTKLCRDALMTLTGLSASVLQAARTDALAGKVSVISCGAWIAGTRHAGEQQQGRRVVGVVRGYPCRAEPHGGQRIPPGGPEGILLLRPLQEGHFEKAWGY